VGGWVGGLAGEEGIKLVSGCWLNALALPSHLLQMVDVWQRNARGAHWYMLVAGTAWDFVLKTRTWVVGRMSLSCRHKKGMQECCFDIPGRAGSCTATGGALSTGPAASLLW
jgi:hypothetical protein